MYSKQFLEPTESTDVLTEISTSKTVEFSLQQSKAKHTKIQAKRISEESKSPENNNLFVIFAILCARLGRSWLFGALRKCFFSNQNVLASKSYAKFIAFLFTTEKYQINFDI